MLDEVSSSVAFDARWSSFRDQLLADPAIERTVLLLFAAGVKPPALRSLAEAFDDNWDLVEERVPAAAPDPPPVRTLLDPALAAIRRVCAEPCHDPTTSCACGSTRSRTGWPGWARIDDELDLLEAIGPQANPKPPSFKPGARGKAASWPCDVA